MQTESDMVFNLIEAEFQKLSLSKQKELLQSLIHKLGITYSDKVPVAPLQSNENESIPSRRIVGLHEGKGWISDDFDDELPDEFWGGRV